MARLTQKQIAVHLGLSDRRVRDILQNLKLDPSHNSLGDIRLAYIEDLRQKAGGRNDESLGTARTRETLASAQLKELDLADRYKKVIWVDDLSPLLENLCIGIQSQVMNSGNKIIKSLESKYDIDVDDEIILEPLRSALGSVAGSAEELIEDISGKSEKTVA